MNIRIVAALALALGGAPAALAQGTESYGVFCARGRVAVDSRSAEQMQSGQGACQLARFSDRTSAEGFARRNFGGLGGSCSCR
jgi:hypothetical protein